jgi:hypothetical protein
MRKKPANPFRKSFVAAYAFALAAVVAPAAQAITILPSCARDQSGKAADIGCALSTFTNIAKLIFGVTGSFALLMFVIGGFMILSSAGNQEKVNKGKQYLTNAVIGIFIILTAAYFVQYGESLLRSGTMKTCRGGYYTTDNGQQQCCDGQVAVNPAKGKEECAANCSAYSKITATPWSCMSTKNLPDGYSCVPYLCPGKSDNQCCSAGIDTTGSTSTNTPTNAPASP